MGSITTIPTVLTNIVDNSTIETSGGKIQVKDDGVTSAKILDGTITSDDIEGGILLTNHASGLTPTATAVLVDGSACSFATSPTSLTNITDDDYSTTTNTWDLQTSNGGITSFEGTADFKIDLGEAKQVDTLFFNITIASTSAESSENWYSVEVSDNDSDWTQVYTAKDTSEEIGLSSSGTFIGSIPVSRETRYIKVRLHQKNGGSPASGTYHLTGSISQIKAMGI